MTGARDGTAEAIVTIATTATNGLTNGEEDGTPKGEVPEPKVKEAAVGRKARLFAPREKAAVQDSAMTAFTLPTTSSTTINLLHRTPAAAGYIWLKTAIPGPRIAPGIKRIRRRTLHPSGDDYQSLPGIHTLTRRPSCLLNVPTI